VQQHGSLPADFAAQRKIPFVIIVDDDASMREAIRRLIHVIGFRAQTFSSGRELLGSNEIADADCIISDVNMPAMNGLDLFSQLSIRGYRIPTILITGYPDDDTRVRALGAGVICYLTKPFSNDDLIGCIRAALDRDDVKDER
jgi:FixJ family two-component response regulator